MAATFAMMSLSFAGLLPHFVPMLGDEGLTPVSAGRIAGEIGLAVIASRLVVGYLLDRVFAPHIAIVICLVAASRMCRSDREGYFRGVRRLPSLWDSPWAPSST